MKIQVKVEGCNITIPVPTGLIFSRPSVWLWLKIARNASGQGSRYIPDHVETRADDFFAKIPEEAMYALCAELMRIKRKYGSWELVEVHSASGEEVRICL